MSLATFATCLMTIGLMARWRALELSNGTIDGTIARFEADRAVAFGTLLIILTTPWLIIAGIVLRFTR